jgi:HPt (histidine-containing phosphotransfer) domain-containing protein
MTINSKLDLSYLETMSAGDANTMKILLEALLTELKSNQHTARKLCEQKDWVGLERFCHHNKSTLSFSGDETLINTNLKLWDIAKEEGSTPKNIEQQLTLLERNSQKVAQEVSRILKNI